MIAKVNDVAISGYDIDQRAKLLAINPNAPRERLANIALEALISDQLKLQEGKTRGLSASNDEVMARLTELAQNNKMSVAQLRDMINQRGVDFETLFRSIQAEVIWRKLVNGRFGQRLNPAEGEVDSRIEQNRFLDVRQVVVPLPASASDAAVRDAQREALKVRSKISDCGDVDRYIKQYGGYSGPIKGRNPAAKGLVMLEEVPREIRSELRKLSIGQTARPVQTSIGFHIVALCGEQGMSRSVAFSSVMNERAERLAQSYLEDLRRNALLEFK